MYSVGILVDLCLARGEGALGLGIVACVMAVARPMVLNTLSRISRFRVFLVYQ